jgi:DNA-binding MarR family transcriptional regulator
MTDLRAVFGDLVRFQIELWNGVDARLRRDCDLSLGRFEPMRIIAERQGCRVYDIADDLGITVGGVSKIVDRLEISGYCERRANPDDRRSSILHLTPEGIRVLAAASIVFDDELEKRLRSPLSAPSLDALGRALVTLRTHESGIGND